MKSVIFISLFSLFFLFCQFNLFSEDKSNPKAAWILLEEGRVLLTKNDIGKALNLFQQALNKKRGIYPEADIAIGDVFLEEGEYDLALFHYKKAYKYRSAFSIPDEIYSLLYKMSDIYMTRKNYILMIKTLNTVLKNSSFFSDPRYDKLRNSIYSAYINKGLDHLLQLYRFNEDFTIKAHNDLGWFYYRTGRYRESVLNYLFTLISIVSDSVAELKTHDPDYEFTDIADFIKDSFKRDNISDFLIRSNLFKSLYYLAGATYAHGNLTLAKQIYTIISHSNYSGKYKNLSLRQIRNPWIERYINPSPRKIKYPEGR